MIQAIAKEYKFNNCDITFRQDCTVDELIDVIERNVSSQNNRRRLRWPRLAPQPMLFRFLLRLALAGSMSTVRRGSIDVSGLRFLRAAEVAQTADFSPRASACPHGCSDFRLILFCLIPAAQIHSLPVRAQQVRYHHHRGQYERALKYGDNVWPECWHAPDAASCHCRHPCASFSFSSFSTRSPLHSLTCVLIFLSVCPLLLVCARVCRSWSC